MNDEEPERRFQDRIDDPTKRWKLSPMDLKAREHWVEYSKAKDIMVQHTHIRECPWHFIHSNCKRRARLNCIAHLLRQIPYSDLTPEPLELPLRQPDSGYERPPLEEQPYIEEVY